MDTSRDRACRKKIRHRTQRAAVEHQQHLKDKQDEDVAVYHCHWCDCFHVGHAGNER